MATRIHAFDWSATPLGAALHWPAELRAAAAFCLNATTPTALYWGDDLHILYNDAWRALAGKRHPQALGRSAQWLWGEAWPGEEAELRAVIAARLGRACEARPLPAAQAGRPDDRHWDYNVTPITCADGQVAGVLQQGQETTARVFADRRNALLVAFGDAARALERADDIVAAGVALLGQAIGVGRVGYGEMDAARQSVTVAQCWTDGTLPDLSGAIAAGSYGAGLHETLAGGRPHLIADTHDDPRLSADGVVARYDATGMRAGIAVPIMDDGRYVAILFAHSAAPRAWGEHHVGLLTDFADRLWQEVRRARAEAALRISEKRHRLLFEQAHDIIFTADLDQRITSVNPAAAAAFGTAAGAIVGRPISDFLSPEDFARASAMLAEKLRHGGTTRYEVEVLPPDGRRLRWEVSSTLNVDRDGRVVGLHAIARDVTARHAADQRQQRLIDELNHRVKNMLAIVQGLSIQSFRADRRPAAAQAAFQSRLAALAGAHDRLTQGWWEGAALAGLIGDAAVAHAGRIAADGPAIMVGPKAAVSLVLAFHELASNAADYGALSVPQGRVAVRWWTENDRLRLEWRETGGPPATAPGRRGFGLRLIERALASELGGQAVLDFTPTGLICTIDAPLPSVGHSLETIA